MKHLNITALLLLALSCFGQGVPYVLNNGGRITNATFSGVINSGSNSLIPMVGYSVLSNSTSGIVRTNWDNGDVWIKGTLTAAALDVVSTMTVTQLNAQNFSGNLSGGTNLPTGGLQQTGGSILFTNPISGSNATFTGTVSASAISATTGNAGTLVVTNPPYLDLRFSTNLNANTTFYPSNSTSLSLNMLLKETDFQTNAAFAFTGFANLSATNYQHKVVHVFYTGFGQSSGVAITWPANTHVQGTSYLTNQTDIAVDYNPLIPITNVLCLPRW